MYIDFDGEVIYIKVFKTIPTLIRYFNYYKLNSYKVRRYLVQELVYGTYAGISHTNRTYIILTPRYMNYKGPYKASNRGYPKYKRRVERLYQTNYK